MGLTTSEYNRTALPVDCWSVWRATLDMIEHTLRVCVSLSGSRTICKKEVENSIDPGRAVDSLGRRIRWYQVQSAGYCFGSDRQSRAAGSGSARHRFR